MALHAEYVSTQVAALTEQGQEPGKRAAKITGQSAQY